MNIASKLFESIFGIPESEWDFQLHSLPNYNRDDYKYGIFETKPLTELELLFNEAKLKENDKMPVFEVRLHNGINNNNKKYFDVSCMQYNSEEKYKPLFQVASNFNCLEVASSLTNPFSGKFITHQLIDSTQGPSAASGCIHGNLTKLSIHNTNNINLLENIDDIEVNNGKCYNYNTNTNASSINYKDVKIGILRDVYATIDRSNVYDIKYNDKGRKITQIYSSTCIQDDNKPSMLSELFLKAAYEGLFLYACINGNKDIYLTLIGGGVFYNNRELILRTIINSFNKYKSYLPKDCKVILPIYDTSNNKLVTSLFNKVDESIISYYY